MAWAIASPDPALSPPPHQRIQRSEAAKSAFKRANPCPANGNPAGPCPGWVIDHIQPLCAGGADAPINMQWQEKAESLVKDKTEWATCRALRKNNPTHSPM